MIYLLAGAPRCGKSTLAHDLSRRRNLPSVSTDLLRGVLMMVVPALREAMHANDPQREAEVFYPHLRQTVACSRIQLPHPDTPPRAQRISPAAKPTTASMTRSTMQRAHNSRKMLQPGRATSDRTPPRTDFPSSTWRSIHFQRRCSAQSGICLRADECRPVRAYRRPPRPLQRVALRRGPGSHPVLPRLRGLRRTGRESRGRVERRGSRGVDRGGREGSVRRPRERSAGLLEGRQGPLP